ncbi:uncharacterized protein LOC124373150 isoform X3 [Homalodisca vitripennis]|uniref:uncharacterized protein LOC124373150 isoform X3 n=1 Tax=Homalodisca vitripennis TaxID=197043 RepID=UPI001EEC95D5|nr:uncharacterized protein LOC124373150 isoform X3 [Homalodisca vitripennis]
MQQHILLRITPLLYLFNSLPWKHSFEMLFLCLFVGLILHVSLAQVYNYRPGTTPASNPYVAMMPMRPPGCGACPPADCRTLPPIVWGFCCGCALPFDRVPISCPANMLCPPLSPLLCHDYNYLMNCCC